jgi:hypothetical protein
MPGGRKRSAPEPPPHRGGKKRANLSYKRLLGDKCLTESDSERAENELARLVALAFKAEHPELFASAPAPSSNPASLPTPGE